MAARIRADLVGQLMAHRRTDEGRVIRVDPVYLSAGDEVPEGVLVSKRHLEESADSSTGPGAGDGEGGSGAGEGTAPAGPPPFDPDEFSVDDVNSRLADLDEADVRAVLEAEAAGRSRKGIIDGPVARSLPHTD